eukprot:gene21045-7884_t
MASKDSKKTSTPQNQLPLQDQWKSSFSAMVAKPIAKPVVIFVSVEIRPDRIPEFLKLVWFAIR